MFRYIFPVIIACALASCSTTPEQVIVELPALRASSIFRDDSVYAYMTNATDQQKQIAESYFKKGIEAKETNPKKAIYFLKRSITLHPTGDAYRELGKLLMSAKIYDEAYMLYGFLSRKAYLAQKDTVVEKYLFGEPDTDIHYEYLLAFTMNSNYLDGYILHDMKNTGIDMEKIKKRLLSDPRFTYDTTSASFKNFMFQFLSDEEIKQLMNSEGNFRNFLASIKDTSLNFSIEENAVSVFNYDRYNGDYEAEGLFVPDLYMHYLVEKKENPNGWFEYNSNHVIPISKDVTAVIYAIDTSETACPREMRHVYHRLVTYGKGGRIIDSKIVAWQSGEEMATFRYFGNGNYFVVTPYTRTWKKPYEKMDFDNYIISTEPGKQLSYTIDESGKIIESI